MNYVLAWFARNNVAANLLMMTIIVGGLLMIPVIKVEIFPEFETDIIIVTVPYLGAAPAEVEEAVCVRVEEAIQDLDGIKRLSSTAAEGVGTIQIEVDPDADARTLLHELKSRVDAIDTLPEETEKPVVREILFRRQVIDIAVAGNLDETYLKRLGEEIREGLLAQPEISQVQLASVRPYEISIEVSEAALRRYGLTFTEVVNAVRSSSLDLPGGSVKTPAGEILLRAKGQALVGAEFDQIVLRSRPDGTRLLLSHVARVVDGFAETDVSSRFDGKPTALVKVFRVGNENILDVSGAVHRYVDEKRATLPSGVELTTWQDQSKLLESRLDLMINNGQLGFLLVFLCLALFMRIRLAFWVAMGIVICFLGTFWMMPLLGASINMLSLFAFIMVLGIVVDDAIIAGENIYAHQERGVEPSTAARIGVQEIAKPIIFAVLTTIVAFSPMFFVEGLMGKFFEIFPIVIILMLLFSLVESLFILPTHLRHGQPERRDRPMQNTLLLIRPFYLVLFYLDKWLHDLQDTVARYLRRFVEGVYVPLLKKALAWRYVTLSIGVGAIVLTVGLVAGGILRFVFFPSIENEYVAAHLTMPQGTSSEVTSQVISRIEDSAVRLQRQLNDEITRNYPEDDPHVVRHVMAAIGEQPYAARSQQNAGAVIGSASASHIGEVALGLSSSETRSISSEDIVNRWRELIGPIPDVVELSYTSSLFNVGEAINMELASPDHEDLLEATAELKRTLANYNGVLDVADDFRPGKQEIRLTVTPEGEALGISMAGLSRQVRQAFYGEEAQRIQRGRDDVRVMVRYPETERRSLGDMENMRIRTPTGIEVPFSLAAMAEMDRGYSNIRRKDRMRVITVTADVNDTVANANDILGDLTTSYMPSLMARYPNLTYSLEGEQRNQQESIESLSFGFLVALLVIYGLLAIPFKSYIQPMIIMSVIPFGIVGAVMGHLIMGFAISLLSLFGIVALSGVVVNDSLVLVDFINRGRERSGPDADLHEIIRNAGVARFRPVLLTSLTTFAGLTPILMEESLQAQFLIPMAISLGFGVLFATAITLILVPISYYILEDGLSVLARIQSRVKGQVLESGEVVETPAS